MPKDTTDRASLQGRVQAELYSGDQGELAGPLGEAIAEEAGNYSLEFVSPEAVARGIAAWLLDLSSCPDDRVSLEEVREPPEIVVEELAGRYHGRMPFRESFSSEESESRATYAEARKLAAEDLAHVWPFLLRCLSSNQTDHLQEKESAAGEEKFANDSTRRRCTNSLDHPQEPQGGGEDCKRCGRGNVVWFAPSPLWNAVMRGGSIDGEPEFSDLVCASCFMQLAEEQGIATRFRVFAEEVNVELETTTPSGRVWDDERWLWVEPSSGAGVPSEPDFSDLDALQDAAAESDSVLAEAELHNWSELLLALRENGWAITRQPKESHTDTEDSR